MFTNKPVTEGVTESESAFAKPDKYISNEFSDKRSLSEWSKEFVLFTHALYFQVGRLTVEPISDYGLEKDAFMTFVTPEPVFQDFPGYENKLYGVVKSEWENFSKFINAVSGIDRADKFFWAGYLHTVPLLDFMSKEGGNYVSVNIFGVKSNKGSYVGLPAVAPSVDHRIKIVRLRPDQEFIAFAEKMLKES